MINHKKLARNKAKDLNDIGIALEIVPLILKGEQFDYTKFYGVNILTGNERFLNEK
jgi:hypothetical protein